MYVPGPNMTAFHTMILSGHGLPEIPLGGSVERRLKSRTRRLLQFVDYLQWLATDLRSELTLEKSYHDDL